MWKYYCSFTKPCPAPCDPMDCSMPGSSVLQYLPEFAQTHVPWLEDAIKPSHHVLPPSPPTSIFPSIKGFFNESAYHIKWPKYWSFSFNISLSNEHSKLISFRIDWFGHLAFQGTLKSLFQQHSSKTSILQLSAFFMFQFSNLYMTIGKTIALTVWTFVGKVMSLISKYTV